MHLTFRCPQELAATLPPPIPAVEGLPDWFKAMPQKAFNPLMQEATQTVKRCPPFIDAMTLGFLIPLASEVQISNGEFKWDMDLPPGPVSIERSPISFHDPSQVEGSPFFSEDQFVVKFINFWTIEAPPGYSILFTHPVNRPDLPFTTITGLVDCDRYKDSLVHFPALWNDPDFSGTLPKGTPVAQCIPVKRDDWSHELASFTDEQAIRLREVSSALKHNDGIYRRQFRAKKR